MPGAKLRAELITQVYNKLGVVAANVGELDLVLGVNYLKELATKQKFPFISANLVDAKGAPIFKPYVIKSINGKNVGIFGIMGDTSEMSGKVSDITNGAAKVTDALDAAEAIVKELSGKVDYMIALTHQGTNRDWVIARRIKGIDLVVGGHDKQKTKDPNEAEKTLIVQAGEKGQYQGIMEVSLSGTKTSKNTLAPLGETIADDTDITKMIEQYNDKLGTIYKSPAGENPVPASVSLRLSACEKCHPKMAEKWKTTAHAKAYSTLVKTKNQNDPKCLACHTTRFEQPDGFSMKQQQMELVNVQCESCHGLAKDHLSSMKPIPTKKPAIDVCKKCHNNSDRCKDCDTGAKTMFEKIKH
jgi:2',3'-cyclic-nucleotide 2'-phosphodiesterase (5'-nucleotidase family)